MLIAFLVWYLADIFTGAGIDEAALYTIATLNFDFPVSQYLSLLLVVGLTVGLIVALAWLSISNRKKPSKKSMRVWSDLAYLICLIGFLCFSNPAANYYQLVKPFFIQTAGASTLFEVAKEYYSGQAIKLNPRYNYVHIYAESVDQRFKNINGTNYIPRLTELADEYLEFTNIRQFPGGCWTIGGIVNTQCGIPLTLVGNCGNKLDYFLPNAVCIGDVMATNSHRNLFIRGASNKFAGADKYFKTHHIEGIDLDYFSQNSIFDKSDISGWGVHDDVLLDFALDKFYELSKAKKPFVMNVLTVNTHGLEEPFLNACAGNVSLPSNSEPITKLVACADYLLDNFVRKIISSEYFENTIIVITSDHLSRNIDDLVKDLEEPPTNTFIVIKKGLIGIKNDTPGFLFDVWPTVLDLSGVKANGLGFGRSLFSKRERNTIIDKHLNGEALNEYQQFANIFWGFKSKFFLNDLKFNEGQLSLRLVKINLPTIMEADGDRLITVATDTLDKKIYMDRFLYNDNDHHSNIMPIYPLDHDRCCLYLSDEHHRLIKKIIGKNGIERSSIVSNEEHVFNKLRNDHDNAVLQIASCGSEFEVFGNIGSEVDGIKNIIGVKRGVNLMPLYNDQSFGELSNYDVFADQEISASMITKLLKLRKVKGVLIWSHDSAARVKGEKNRFINELADLLGRPELNDLDFRQTFIAYLGKNKAELLIGNDRDNLSVMFNSRLESLTRLVAKWWSED